MALNQDSWKSALKPLLKSGLDAIHQQMHSGDETKDDAWYAEQLADLLASSIAATGTNQIKTAGIPAGSVVIQVTGQAAGVPNAAEITVK
jgi:hypothetical protein